MRGLAQKAAAPFAVVLIEYLPGQPEHCLWNVFMATSDYGRHIVRNNLSNNVGHYPHSSLSAFCLDVRSHYLLFWRSRLDGQRIYYGAKLRSSFFICLGMADYILQLHFIFLGFHWHCGCYRSSCKLTKSAVRAYPVCVAVNPAAGLGGLELRGTKGASLLIAPFFVSAWPTVFNGGAVRGVLRDSPVSRGRSANLYGPVTHCLAALGAGCSKSTHEEHHHGKPTLPAYPRRTLRSDRTDLPARCPTEPLGQRRRALPERARPLRPATARQSQGPAGTFRTFLTDACPGFSPKWGKNLSPEGIAL